MQHRPGKPVVGEELAAPGMRVVCSEHLDAVVEGVCQVDGTVGRHRHAARSSELPVAAALRSPRTEKGAIGAEALDAVVVRICHVDRAVGRHRHVGRIAELPVAAALRPPRAQEGSGGTEALDAVVAASAT
jgi:hypothetical protein